jgi:hypothetical protein
VRRLRRRLAGFAPLMSKAASVLRCAGNEGRQRLFSSLPYPETQAAVAGAQRGTALHPAPFRDRRACLPPSRRGGRAPRTFVPPPPVAPRAFVSPRATRRRTCSFLHPWKGRADGRANVDAGDWVFCLPEPPILPEMLARLKTPQCGGENDLIRPKPELSVTT